MVAIKMSPGIGRGMPPSSANKMRKRPKYEYFSTVSNTVNKLIILHHYCIMNLT